MQLIVLDTIQRVCSEHPKKQREFIFNQIEWALSKLKVLKGT